MKYFNFFNLEPAFILDEAALRRQFLQNSKNFHPDFYTLESEEKQAEILESSTLNNEAYKVLSNPAKRMQYILQELGLLQEGENNKQLSQDFLMEMMDINEELADLSFDFDKNRLEALKKNLEIYKMGLFEKISPLLESFSLQNSNKIDLNLILSYYLKTKYLNRLEEKMSSLEHENS